MNEQGVAQVETLPVPSLPSLSALALKFWKEVLGGGASNPGTELPQSAVGEIIKGW